MTGLEVRRPALAHRVVQAPRRLAEPLRVHWAWQRSRGHRHRLAGRPLLAPVDHGRLRPPGMVGETLLFEAPDARRREMGFGYVPATGHLSVTLDCTLRNSGSTRSWLAELQAWMSGHARDPAVAGVTILLRPPRCLLVQVTWIPDIPGRIDPAALAIEAGSRVPPLADSIADAGVGRAAPVPATRLAHVVRSAYRCGSLDSTGTDHETLVPSSRHPWTHAGPDGHRDAWSVFHHGSAVSRTWSVPQAVVRHLEFDDTELTRHRLALCAPGTALLTVTSLAGMDELDARAVQWLARLPRGARPLARVRYGSQAAAFAAALPTGTLLQVHAQPSDSDRR